MMTPRDSRTCQCERRGNYTRVDAGKSETYVQIVDNSIFVEQDISRLLIVKKPVKNTAVPVFLMNRAENCTNSSPQTQEEE